MHQAHEGPLWISGMWHSGQDDAFHLDKNFVRVLLANPCSPSSSHFSSEKWAVKGLIPFLVGNHIIPNAFDVTARKVRSVHSLPAYANKFRGSECDAYHLHLRLIATKGSITGGKQESSHEVYASSHISTQSANQLRSANLAEHTSFMKIIILSG